MVHAVLADALFLELDAADCAEIDVQVRALDRWCRVIYEHRQMERARD
ncbi:hypothetical protein [Kitasatospora purpeofusca]